MIRGLTVNNLALARGDRLLFEGLGLSVKAGEAVTLTGANGAGKTSLLRAIAGFIRPAAGAVTFDTDLEPEEARSRGLHFLGHQDGLKTGRTAWDELLFQTLWTGGSETAARGAVEQLSLAPLLNLEVRKLSAGQRRRLALARLIASPRPVWLLDEPMAPLDTERRVLFGALMAQHIEDGGMIIAAVHDPLPIHTRDVEVRGMNGFGVLLRRELSLAWGKGGGPLLALTFYAAVTGLLVLSIGAQAAEQRKVALGAAWLALALASLLSLERLFERDFEDGGLDLLTLGGLPLEATCFAKCLAQWIAQGLPLALAAPVAAVATPQLAPMIFVCALIGGLAFSFVGGFGASLAIGSRRGGVLIAVIVLPLFAPPVIFGAGAMDAFASGLDWRPGLTMLAGYAVAWLAIGPLVMAAAVRNVLS